METFSALLALCAANSPFTGDFSTERPVTQSFDIFFDLCLNKRLSKQSWGWWSETPSRLLWRHCNDWQNITVTWAWRRLKLLATNLWKALFFVWIRYVLFLTLEWRHVNVMHGVSFTKGLWSRKLAGLSTHYIVIYFYVTKFNLDGNLFLKPTHEVVGLELSDFPHTDVINVNLIPLSMKYKKVLVCLYTVECHYNARSNIVRYHIYNYRNWGKISTRCWIYKRHPIPRPNGRVFPEYLCENWPRYNGTALCNVTSF